MAPADAGAPRVRVEVVYCPRPGEIDRRELQLPAGTDVAAALEASGVIGRHGLALETLRVGVWCKLRALDTLLRDQDRVEVYRPLTVDPKEARRQRYKGQREGQREGQRQAQRAKPDPQIS